MRDFIFYLEDMFQSIKRIEKYTKNLSYNDFAQNQIVIDDVVRNFEIIGEASHKIPNEITEKYPNMPWQKMYALRNLIAHEYFGIDEEIIWQIITKDLPSNKLY